MRGDLTCIKDIMVDKQGRRSTTEGGYRADDESDGSDLPTKAPKKYTFPKRRSPNQTQLAV